MTKFGLMKTSSKKLLSEDAVKKMLGIKDFRNVSKSQVVELVSSLSQMDPEVAKKVIEQVPELSKTALGMAKEVKDSYTAGLKSNDESSKSALERIDVIIKILESELKNENLTPEERIELFKALNDVSDKPVQIHRDNQKFIERGLRIVAGTVVAGFAGVLVVLGANGKIEIPDVIQDNLP